MKIVKAVGAALLVCALTLLNPVVAEAATTGATVYASFKDARGTYVELRKGSWDGLRGFGWEKINRKHGIHKYSTVGFTIKNPAGPVKEGSQRRYTAYANEKVCRNGTCKYVDSIEVRTIVETAYKTTYYGVRVNDTLGVMTTYCIGYTVCPSWVDVALSKSSTTNTDTTSQAVWSYEPLAEE